MLPRRKIASTVSLLAVTLALLLASALAWACAPAATPTQDGAPAAEAEPTATATPTPTPTPSVTPVYYPEVIPQRNSELNPVLNAFIIRNMAASSSGGGASGQTEPSQQAIPMAIEVSKYDDSADLRSFLESNGAIINYASTSSLPEGTTSFKFNGVLLDPPYTWSDGSTLFLADVPINLLPELVKRTDPESIGYTGELPYPNLSPVLNELVIAYEAGLLPSDDWPTALVEVRITDPRPYIELNLYLTDKKDEGAVIIADDYYQYMTYGAEVPLGLIAPMSELPGVEQVELFVYPPPPGYVDQVLGLQESDDAADVGGQSGSGGVNGNQGSGTQVTETPTPSAGSKAHEVPAWRQAGYTGSNVKVGIIDWGFARYSKGVNMGKLPTITAENCPLMYGGCGPVDSLYHGSAVAEAVHDIAPDAHLYIASLLRPFPANRLNSDIIPWMHKSRVDVIVHSVGWPFGSSGDGSVDVSDKIGEAVNRAITAYSETNPLTRRKINNDAILWVNAAGNQANFSWFSTKPAGGYAKTSGYIHFQPVNGATLNATIQPPPPKFNSPANTPLTPDCNPIRLDANNIYYFNLRWDDNFPGADINLNLYLTDYVGISDIPTHIKGRGDDLQSGKKTMSTKHYPLEQFKVHTFSSLGAYLVLSFDNTYRAPGYYCVRIKHDTSRNSVEPDWIQLQILAVPNAVSTLTYSTGSHSVVNPAEILDPLVLAVGASDLQPIPSIEDYSSRGPLPDSAETKPDIVGATGAHSVVKGGTFTGTSQAAPHIGGLAALFFGRFPAYSAELVSYFLRASARQQDSPDPNHTWGHGFALLPSPTAIPSQPSRLAGTGGNGSVTLSWNDANNATGFVVQQWDGRNVRWSALPFRETAAGYDRAYTYELTGAGAKIGNLINGVSYAHRVKSTNGSRSSGWTTWVSTAAVFPVTLTTRLRGISLHRSVSLDWNDVAGATSYQVQQWDGRAGRWRTLPFRESHVNYDYTITFDGSSAVVGRLTNGVSYAHRVQAVKGSDTFGWTSLVTTAARGLVGGSDPGGATGQADPTPAPDSGAGGASGQDDSPGSASPTPTPPMPQNEPSSLTAAYANGAVTLSWTPGSNPHYVKQVVKRRERGVRPEVWTDFELDASADTYTDATVASGKTYIYRVKGLRDNGRGGDSNRATVTIP